MTTQTIPWQDYLEVCKPKVVLLMLLTALVGMCLAVPGAVPINVVLFSSLGIACVAGSAAAINHLLDRQIDQRMARTKKRPVATGKLKPLDVILFATLLGSLGMVILWHYVNHLTAWLSLLTLIGYAGIYTVFLKRATPQNIVIGGAAGAAPPVLGWVAVTGQLDPMSLLLALIIFTWTPPHFWALSLYRYQEYAKAEIPMLPVTHGIRFTKLCIMLYTLLMVVSSLMPTLVGMSGTLYFVCALILGLRFIYWAWRLLTTEETRIAVKTFRFSIIYLMTLFTVLLIDHYL